MLAEGGVYAEKHGRRKKNESKVKSWAGGPVTAKDESQIIGMNCSRKRGRSCQECCSQAAFCVLRLYGS